MPIIICVTCGAVCGDTSSVVMISTNDKVTPYQFCSDLHALLFLMKRCAKRMKAETGEKSIRLYQTASAILNKLSKALEREWVKTKAS